MTPDEAFSMRALYEATRRAAREKRARPAVARFWLDLPTQLVTLRDALRAGRWQPATPKLFRVNDPKPRVISVLPFGDRVVHQALWAVIAPRVERRLITDTYACRVGLGTHAALRRATAWARAYRYYAHLDVARFFPSVDHAIVREHIARDLREPWLRAMCDRILRAGVTEVHRAHFPGDELFTPFERDVGLPLGNLTSQLWANRYLDPVDHFVKETLRLRPYLRYMDDMLLFGDDRAALAAAARAVEERCWALRLRLHPYDVRPTREGVSFVGYRILRDHVRVRRSTVARAERRLQAKVVAMERGEITPQAMMASLRATFGHWKHAATWRLRLRTLRRIGLDDDPLWWTHDTRE